MIETIDPTPTPVAFTDPVRIDDFLAYLARRDCAPGTIKAYCWGVSDFLAFLRSQGLFDLHQTTRRHLEVWEDRLIAAKLRPRSRSLAVTATRGFLRWAADHDACDPRLAAMLTTVKVGPLHPKPLPPADLAALVGHYTPRPPSGPYELPHLRDRAMFFVFLTTGARVSEGLAMPRVGFERCTVRQKGGSDKLLTVPEGVQSIVREYLAARVDDSPHLFVNHPSGERMGPSGVRQVWQTVARQLRISPVTTHQLRHTYATQLLAQGIDIRVIAELMGHKNMQSIMIYTRVLESSRKRAEDAIAEVLQLPPPDPRAVNGQSDGGRGRPRFQIA